MYNENKLCEKVQGHLKENEITLLKSLVEDIDEFNEKFGDKFAELYVDFDNVGNDSEFDPYGTFKLHLENKVPVDLPFRPCVTSELSLHDLDVSVAAIYGYFDELKTITDKVDEGFKKDNDKLYNIYQNNKKEGYVVYKTIEGLQRQKLEDITKQHLDGLLYDINRLPEVITTLKDNDIKKYSQHWLNDLALIDILKYYYNKCADLETKLKLAEDKNIVNSIIK